MSSPATDAAIEFVCAKDFHQCLWLPANESHERLRVTFATTTNFSDPTLPVVLFCPPMFGGRSLIIHLNHLAEQTGVRVVCADRPGMGGSTPVPIDIRVKVWLETVPVLLKRVGIEHVSIACHSAGTIYALNTLYHFREMLDPKAPYVGLLAPWVDNVYSRTTLMNMASKLPTGVVDHFAGVTKFINQKIAPVASWSGGILSSSASLFQGAKNADEASDEDELAKRYGVDKTIAKEINRLTMKFYFAEDTTAGNEDAKLCLKKAGSGSWGACEDYAEFAKEINGREKERLSDRDSRNDSNTRLRLHVWFAESDVMIGKAGQQYFNDCWKPADSINFKTIELPETNHETVILSYDKGGLKTMFEEIRTLGTG